MKPLEPWAGYAKMTTDQRKQILDKKIANAKGIGDQPYALALTAAVVNYELVISQNLSAAMGGKSPHDKDIQEHAHEHYHGASSWIGT